VGNQEEEGLLTIISKGGRGKITKIMMSQKAKKQ
jgi:hypothetical protein